MVSRSEIRESIGCDAQRGVVMEAADPATFEVPETDLLLELLIVALDAPAQLGKLHQATESHVLGKRREPVFGWFFLAFGPLDQQPFLWSALGALLVAPRDTNTHTSGSRGQVLG